MKTILPIVIDDAVLVSSSVPENDAAVWNAGTVYSVGNACIEAHKVYSSLVASNAGKRPSENTTGTSPKWSVVGYTNQRKMFDEYSNTQTTGDSEISVVLHVSYCNAVALFNLDAESIDIEVRNSVGDVVYVSTIDLLLSDPQDIEEFVYASREYGDVAWIEFPMMTAATVTLTIRGESVAVGNVILGELKYLGDTQYEASLPTTDYSVFSTNDFGGIYWSQGAYARNVEGEVSVESSRLRSVLRVATALRATPTAFFCANEVHADGLSDTMIAYGLLRTFEPTIKRPTVQEISFKIVGVK